MSNLELETTLNNAPTIQEKVDAVNAAIRQQSRQSPQLALQLGREAYALARDANPPYRQGMADAALNLGRLHFRLAQYDQAQAYLMPALTRYQELEQAEQEVQTWIGLGLVQWRLADYPTAAEHHLQAAAIAREAGDRTGEADALFHLGLVYGSMGDIGAALKTYRQVRELWQCLDDRLQEGFTLNNLAMAFWKDGEFEEAWQTVSESLEIAREYENVKLEIVALDTAGNIKLSQGDSRQALNYFQQSQRLAVTLSYEQDQLSALVGIGLAYEQQKQIDLALDTWQEALDLAEKLATREDMRRCHKLLAQLYKTRGDLVAALHHYEQFHELDRAIYNETADMRLKTLQVIHDTEAAQLKSAALEKEMAEQRRLEAALRQAHKIESLGILAGGVAHDFNNLLVAILGQMSLARRQLDPENPARHHVEKAVKAAERAADLAQKMLAYSGRGHFTVQPLDLNALVSQNLTLFATGLPQNVRLQTDLVAELPLIKADPDQMKQVIQNLILNGAEAIGDRAGAVAISTGVTEIETADDSAWQHISPAFGPGHYIRLQVQDNGQGMSEEAVAQIFDPFFTMKATGHGLGLAVVLGIVRGHGGAIRVDTEQGVGSTFTLLFPVSEESAALPVPGDATPAPVSARLVLIVDDEEPVREAVSDVLGEEGIETIQAGDGRSGLELYQAHMPEIGLVILDLSMPGMSGQETLQELRQLNSAVPVLLSSGYSREDVVRSFEAEGVASFLQKPYSIADLIQKVQELMPPADT
jgi:signal transduction histidine kinase/ActR/RegA family two-component response regulator/predicted secreted protein